MEFMFESTDFNQVKLEIYEQCNSGMISEKEKNALLEAVAIKEINEEIVTEAAMLDMAAMAKVMGLAAGGVAAASAIILLIMKVASILRTKDKIKASSELTAINNDIKKCSTKLKQLRSEIQSTINEYRTEIFDAETRADFYGSRIVTQTSFQYNYNTGYTDPVSTTQYNHQYDKKKSEKERKNAERLRKVVQKYIAKRDELSKEITNLKHLKSRFLAVVRNNMGPDEYENIRAELDKIMANVDKA